MGHDGFYRLGSSLKSAGCNISEIRTILTEQYFYANNPKERLSEINSIIKSLTNAGISKASKKNPYMY